LPDTTQPMPAAAAAASSPTDSGSTGMSLLNTIKQNSQNMTNASTQQGQALGFGPTGGTNTQQLAALTGTAATGKASGPGVGVGAKMSSLSEKLAGVNNLTSAANLGAQGAMQSTAQAQQAQAQAQQTSAASAALTQQRVDMMASFNDSVNSILQSKADEIANMTVADDKARVEQVGLMLRLSNEKYVTTLNDTAAKSRADTAAGFQQAIQTSIFADETDLMSSNLQFRNYMSQQGRDATATLASMDLGFAMSIAAAQNKGASMTAAWSGLGGIVSGGAQMYAAANTAGETGGDVTGSAPATDSSVDSSGAAAPAVSIDQLTDPVGFGGATAATGGDAFTQVPNASAGG